MHSISLCGTAPLHWIILFNSNTMSATFICVSCFYKSWHQCSFALRCVCCCLNEVNMQAMRLESGWPPSCHSTESCTWRWPSAEVEHLICTRQGRFRGGLRKTMSSVFYSRSLCCFDESMTRELFWIVSQNTCTEDQQNYLIACGHVARRISYQLIC